MENEEMLLKEDSLKFLQKEIEKVMIDSYSRFIFTSFYTEMLEEYILIENNIIKSKIAPKEKQFDGKFIVIKKV
jgi:hypothetical protein